jgi:predicted RNA-binding Zn ribbon-like protein
MSAMSTVPPADAGLALAIAFVNTYDLLESPPDILTMERVVAITRAHRHPQLANRLAAIPPARADDALDRMRAVRRRLYRIFAAEDAEAAVDALNAALDGQPLHPRIAAGPDRSLRLTAALAAFDPDPIAELAAMTTDALAQAMVVGGPDRFGTCAGDPCRCVYVDRTRAGRQRFCCQLCNDRMAAAAYRSRRAGAT